MRHQHERTLHEASRHSQLAIPKVAVWLLGALLAGTPAIALAESEDDEGEEDVAPADADERVNAGTANEGKGAPKGKSRTGSESAAPRPLRGRMEASGGLLDAGCSVRSC